MKVDFNNFRRNLVQAPHGGQRDFKSRFRGGQ